MHVFKTYDGLVHIADDYKSTYRKWGAFWCGINFVTNEFFEQANFDEHRAWEVEAPTTCLRCLVEASCR